MKRVTVLLILLIGALAWYLSADVGAIKARSDSPTLLSVRDTPAVAAEEAVSARQSKTQYSQAVDPPKQISAQAPITEPQYVPPIAKDRQQADAYQGDLHDHQAYQRYQQRQHNDFKRAYISAAKDKVALLKTWLARGEREGISPEQLQFARDKIAALEQAKQQLEEQLAQQ